MQKERSINGTDPVLLLGSNDVFLRQIELALPSISIRARGHRLVLDGPPDAVAQAEAVLDELERLLIRNGSLTARDVQTVLALATREGERQEAPRVQVVLQTPGGQTIAPKTPNQARLVAAAETNDVVFAIGPAGTGKTYVGMALAVAALRAHQVKRIVLARPAVEAGEQLGFLPGDLREKIDPYLRPLYDALEDMLSRSKLEAHLEEGVIEIVPLAYMRGRTLRSAFVILDEAQNATRQQMKMFLTRLGPNSRAIVTGDVTQTDLPSREHSGLVQAEHILKPIDGVDFVYFDENDVVRHHLVKQIIKAYERFEDQHPS